MNKATSHRRRRLRRPNIGPRRLDSGASKSLATDTPADDQPTTPATPSTINVRAAIPGDAPAINRISTGPIAHKETFVAESWGRRTVIVAAADSIIAGFAIWDRAFFGRPFVWLLGVAPAYRRRGIATLLLTSIEADCAPATLFTSTNESNLAMQTLLVGLGFTYSGRIDHLDPGDPELFYSKAARVPWAT